jgi:hypothetical protein
MSRKYRTACAWTVNRKRKRKNNMAYFSNGREGEAYEARYCRQCVHDINEDCPILLLHLMHNYEECNKKDSFLHILIPRKGIENEKCRMFWPKGAAK